MEQLKQHATMQEAKQWIRDNGQDIRFLHANRNLSTETVAHKLGKEVQRGMLARHEVDNMAIRDALQLGQSMHDELNVELIKELQEPSCLTISANDLIDIIERAEDSKLWTRSLMAKRFANAISRDLRSGVIVKRGEYLRKA